MASQEEKIDALIQAVRVILGTIQWLPIGYAGKDVCPSCGKKISQTHTEPCELLKAIREIERLADEPKTTRPFGD